MYQNNIINTKENKVLIDGNNQKEQPWREKKLKTIELAESYSRLGMKKTYRVAECGNYLEFKVYENERKLHHANFCKVRLCPMCAWRRSKKIYGQVSKVMDKALEDKEYRFLFLTLTCRNIDGEELSNQMDKLFHAFNLLTKRKIIKQSIKGWFRALEVTHNLKEDTYHPHFHVILMVNKSYFDDSKKYITQKEWTDLWRTSLKVDYNPIVNIKTFKTKTKKQTKKSVAELATYTVKDNNYIVKNKDGEINEELTDSAVWILDDALSRRRLVAFGGELKKIHKQLKLDDTEDGNLINTDNEELREDLSYIIERYKWHVGYKQYIAMD